MTDWSPISTADFDQVVLAAGNSSGAVSRALIDRLPWIFDSKDQYLAWRGDLADGLGVDGRDVLLVGSAATGRSLNPGKRFKAFHRDSDLDIAVVSSFHFDLIGTVSASALGGYWANRSVERQFESQRTAQVQDLRRQVYVDYLVKSTQVCDARQTGDDAKVDKASVALLNQPGQVLLISSPDSDLQDTVTKFTHALILEEDPAKDACADNATYLALRDEFVGSARRDLELA